LEQSPGRRAPKQEVHQGGRARPSLVKFGKTRDNVLSTEQHELQDAQDDDGRRQHRVGRGGGGQVGVPGLSDDKFGTGVVVMMVFQDKVVATHG